jgi:hypothetical protein
MISPIALRRVVAVSLVLASAGIAAYLAPRNAYWVGPGTAAISGALLLSIVLAVAALWRGSPQRRFIGAALLLSNTVLFGFDAGGASLAGATVGPAAYAVLLAIASAAAGLGILLRWRGARWLGIGLGVAGAVSAGLNLSQWMLAGFASGLSWALAVWSLGSLVVIALLSGSDVADQDRLAAREQVWTRRDPLVLWMRAAVVSAIAAAPMLLVYGLAQADAVAEVKAVAPAVAALLAAGAFLGARGMLAGGALLALGAVATLGLAAALVALAPPVVGLRIAGYYLVFWLPSAVCGLRCGVALLRRAGAQR